MVKDHLTYNKIITIEIQFSRYVCLYQRASVILHVIRQKSVDFLTSVRICRRADVSYFGLPDRSPNVLINKKITKIYVLTPFLFFLCKALLWHEYEKNEKSTQLINIKGGGLVL